MHERNTHASCLGKRVLIRFLRTRECFWNFQQSSCTVWMYPCGSRRRGGVYWSTNNDKRYLASCENIVDVTFQCLVHAVNSFVRNCQPMFMTPSSHFVAQTDKRRQFPLGEKNWNKDYIQLYINNCTAFGVRFGFYHAYLLCVYVCLYHTGSHKNTHVHVCMYKRTYIHVDIYTYMEYFCSCMHTQNKAPEYCMIRKWLIVLTDSS